MNDFTWNELEHQLPPDTSPLHKTITWTLVSRNCTPRRGASPGQGSDSCRICFEALAGELALRHEDRTLHPGAAPGPRALRPCGRTYHLACLVEWAENGIRSRRAVTCPGDRQEIISEVTSRAIYDAFDLGAETQHPIRDIDRVRRFWQNLIPEVQNPPVCDFQVVMMHPREALACAAGGGDVGFITADAVARLPLLPDDRNTFNQYNSQTIQRPPRGRRRTTFWERVYEHYIYIDMRRETTNRHGHMFHWYALIPVKYDTGRVFRRYLLGMLGEAYYVSMTRVPRNSRVVVQRLCLTEQEVISLHAETETRKLITAQRGLAMAVYNYPSAVTWYWPFPNNGGGIVIGGVLPDHWFPARGYNLDGLNVGQTNDQRFNILRDDPALNAVEASDRLVNDFVQARLPFEFPRGYGLYQNVDRTGNHLPFQQFVVPMPGHPVPLQPGAGPVAPPAVPQATQPDPHGHWRFQGPVGLPGQDHGQNQLAPQPQPPAVFAPHTHQPDQNPNPFVPAAAFVNPAPQAQLNVPPIPVAPLHPAVDAPNPFGGLPGIPHDPFHPDQLPQVIAIPDSSSGNSSSDASTIKQSSSSGMDRPVWSHSSGSRSRSLLRSRSASPVRARQHSSDSDGSGVYQDIPYRMDVDGQ